jgi:hypothetical protein
MSKKPINQIRVLIPRNPEEKIELAELVFKKDSDLGNASPLAALGWDVQGPNISIAKEKHDKAEELKRQAEILYEERDNLLAPIDDLLKQSRDQLKVTYRSDPRKIGDFGFTVDDTPQKKSGNNA